MESILVNNGFSFYRFYSTRNECYFQVVLDRVNLPLYFRPPGGFHSHTCILHILSLTRIAGSGISFRMRASYHTVQLLLFICLLFITNLVKELNQ